MKADDVERAAFLLKAHSALAEELNAKPAAFKGRAEAGQQIPLCLRKDNEQFKLSGIEEDGSIYDFARIDRDLALFAVRHLLGVITAELRSLGVEIE